jgi:hypothetical protein
MRIYVEILVRAPMDALWSHTQTPALHERASMAFLMAAAVAALNSPRGADQ